MAQDGRLLTWLGIVPSVNVAQFTALNTALTTTFGMTQVGTPQWQSTGGVTAASAMYTAALVQALVRVNEDATLSLYIHILWYGVPDIALLKAQMQLIFGFINPTIFENAVRL